MLRACSSSKNINVVGPMLRLAILTPPVVGVSECGLKLGASSQLLEIETYLNHYKSHAKLCNSLKKHPMNTPDIFNRWSYNGYLSPSC